ncbi:MAG: tail fiber domain-containing protein [Bacilli bacterium]
MSNANLTADAFRTKADKNNAEFTSAIRIRSGDGIMASLHNPSDNSATLIDYKDDYLRYRFGGTDTTKGLVFSNYDAPRFIFDRIQGKLTITSDGGQEPNIGVMRDNNISDRVYLYSSETGQGLYVNTPGKDSIRMIYRNKSSGDTYLDAGNYNIYATSQLVFTHSCPASGSKSHIFHNGGVGAAQDLNIRSMREHISSSWIWEKVNSGALKYTTGTTGAGAARIILNASTGEGFATSGWKVGSDSRFKENIRYVNQSSRSVSYLDKVCGLNAANFLYKDGDRNSRLGLIAQDVKSIIPEAVTEINVKTKDDPEYRLFIDSMAIIAAQTEAIKELKARMEMIETKIA